MTAIGFAACEGAPRDLGFDQGRALRDAIRADLCAIGEAPDRPGLLRRLTGAPPEAALLRDLARHFPHLDERLAGLADGVGCARAAAAALTVRELAGEVLGALARLDPASQALELAWPARLGPTGLVVRAARPDGGYANLTITRPGLVFALAGVNEHGLAGVVQIERPAGPHERCRAPAALLLDQCLERLDGVEKALEWCERRPGGGVARIVLADASGARAAIAIEGETRSRVAAPGEPAKPCDGPRVRVECDARAIEVCEAGEVRRFALPAS